MKPSTLEEVKDLRTRLDPSLAGRYLQRMLALAFLRAGHLVPEERTVDGPDFDMDTDLQVEVKTVAREPFELKEEDLKNIEQAPRRGRRPLLALLEMESFDGWVLLEAEGVHERTLRKRDLALRRRRDLEREVDPQFEEVVRAWVPLVLGNADAAFLAMDRAIKAGEWRPATRPGEGRQ